MPLARALALAVAQLGDPAILHALTKSAALTLALFGALGLVLWAVLDAALARWFGAGAEGLAGVAALVLGITAAWLLFRIVALFAVQFFADDIVRAVEARHYPVAAAVPPLPLRRELANGLKGAGRAVLVNVAAAPVALALLVTGVGTAVLFWAVNAWLIGRELQDMVWLRHARAGDVAPIGAARRFALGGIVSALLLVPFIGLLAPVLGAASAAHLVHRRAP